MYKEQITFGNHIDKGRRISDNKLATEVHSFDFRRVIQTFSKLTRAYFVAHMGKEYGFVSLSYYFLMDVVTALGCESRDS